MAKSLKVLISAYACEPDRGSEPEVGWQTALHLAKLHEVTVLTRANNREVIERGLRGRPGRLPKFIYYDLPAWLLALKGRGMPVFIFYFLWQLGARLRMRGKLDEFDVIHHCTFNSFRQPGFWWLTGKAVVLGPLGGGQICPWRMLPWFRRQIIFEIFRSLTVLCGYVMPQIFTGFLSARRILIANADTYLALPWIFRGKAIRMLETALLPEQAVDLDRSHRAPPVRVLWLSRMDKMKGGELAVRAFASAVKACPEMRLTMAGSGPEEKPLQRFIEKLGIKDSVDWRGRVPKADVLQMMAEHDIFIFTSLRDTSGNVMLEAMGASLPVVCMGHHGTLEISTDETAIRVPVTSRSGTTEALASGLTRLAADRGLRLRMGCAGLAIIRDRFLWPQQAERLERVFQEAYEEQVILTDVTKHHFAAIFSLRGAFMLLVVSMIIALIEFTAVHALSGKAEEVAHKTIPAFTHVASANSALTESFNNVLLAVASENPNSRQGYLKQVEDLSERVTGSLKSFEDTLGPASVPTLFQRLVDARSKFQEIRSSMLVQIESGNRADAMNTYENRLLPAYEAYKKLGNELLGWTADRGTSDAASLILICRITQAVLVVVGFVIFIFGFSVGFSR